VQYLNIGTYYKEETCEEESGRKDRKILHNWMIRRGEEAFPDSAYMILVFIFLLLSLFKSF